MSRATGGGGLGGLRRRESLASVDMPAMSTKGHLEIESSVRHSVAHGLVLGSTTAGEQSRAAFQTVSSTSMRLVCIPTRWNSGQEDVHCYSAINVAASCPNDGMPSRPPLQLPPAFLLSNRHL